MKKKVFDDEELAALRAEIKDQVKAEVEADFGKKFAEHSHPGADKHGVGAVLMEEDPETIFFRVNWDIPTHARVIILRSKLEGNNDLVAEMLNHDRKTKIWDGDKVRTCYAKAMLDLTFTTGGARELEQQSAKEVWRVKRVPEFCTGFWVDGGWRATSPADVLCVRASGATSGKDMAKALGVDAESLEAFIHANMDYITLLEIEKKK